MKIIKTAKANLKLSQMTGPRGPVGPDNPSSDDLAPNEDDNFMDDDAMWEEKLKGLEHVEEVDVQEAAIKAGVISPDSTKLLKPGYYNIRFEDGYAASPLDGPYNSIHHAKQAIPKNIMGDDRNPVYTKTYFFHNLDGGWTFDENGYYEHSSSINNLYSSENKSNKIANRFPRPVSYRFPSIRKCPHCNVDLEKDDEYIYGQYSFEEGPISRVPLKEYPWFCPKCENVWHWDEATGKWVD